MVTFLGLLIGGVVGVGVFLFMSTVGEDTSWFRSFISVVLGLVAFWWAWSVLDMYFTIHPEAKKSVLMFFVLVVLVLLSILLIKLIFFV